MIVEQGDLIEVTFDPTVGHEPRRRRPAVVVSVSLFNNVLSSLVVVCPVSSTDNGHPLHVPLPPGAPASGFVIVEQIRSIDLANPARDPVPLGTLDAETMSVILEDIGGIFRI